MAIEGVAGAVSTYQTAPQVKQAERVESPVKTAGYSGSEGSVNEISNNIRVIENTNDASSGGQKENGEGTNRQPSEETMRQALKDINKRLNNTECVFGMHDKTNRVTIQIIDKDTQEVIKELPPEKTLDMIAKVWELAGILVDERL